jgi:hypothetical protein
MSADLRDQVTEFPAENGTVAPVPGPGSSRLRENPRGFETNSRGTGPPPTTDRRPGGRSGSGGARSVEVCSGAIARRVSGRSTVPGSGLALPYLAGGRSVDRCGAGDVHQSAHRRGASLLGDNLREGGPARHEFCEKNRNVPDASPPLARRGSDLVGGRDGTPYNGPKGSAGNTRSSNSASASSRPRPRMVITASTATSWVASSARLLPSRSRTRSQSLPASSTRPR